MNKIAFVIVSGPSYEMSVVGVETTRDAAIELCGKFNAHSEYCEYSVEEFIMGEGLTASEECKDDKLINSLISGYSTWEEYDAEIAARDRLNKAEAVRKQEAIDREFTKDIRAKFDAERADCAARESIELALVKGMIQNLKMERGASKDRKNAAQTIKYSVIDRFEAERQGINAREAEAVEAALATRDSGGRILVVIDRSHLWSVTNPQEVTE